MTTHATYLDGQSPIKRNAQVSLAGSELEFTIEEVFGARSISLETADIERVRHDVVYIHLDRHSGERLEFTDPEFIQKLQNFKKGWSIDVTKNVGPKVFVALTIVVATAVGLWLATPIIAKVIAHKIPVEQELKLRDTVTEHMKGELCTNSAQNKILQDLADRLLKNSGETYPVKVYFGTTDVVNAFALPGGLVIIHPGIVKKMKSPEALAGVLAHELQHQVQRHITSQLVRATLMTVIWSAALGDFSSLVVLDPGTLFQIASLKYSRDAESEADIKGAELLKNAKIAVIPMLEFLEELSKMSGVSQIKGVEFVSSHPLENRGERLRAQFGDVKTVGEVLSRQDWESLKKGCQTPAAEPQK